jgi:DNA-binding IclR family transcriptional regulator
VIATRGIAPLSELSAATRLNKTTAFYLAETLASLGLAERVEGQGYRLGLKNLELGRAVQRRLDIAAVSRPAMIRLCALSRETVNLAIPFVFDAMIVESLEGAHGVRATSYAGSRASYHSTACGKAILAFMEPNVRKSLYDVRPLAAVTPNTITRDRPLEAQLAAVRERGFALDLEENEIGAHCVAAAIFDGLGDTAGSISISGLAIRWPKRRLIELSKAIIQETKAISAMLGAQSPLRESARSDPRLPKTSSAMRK